MPGYLVLRNLGPDFWDGGWNLKKCEYEVAYKKGSNNTNAGAISRIRLAEGYTNDH